MNRPTQPNPKERPTQSNRRSHPDVTPTRPQSEPRRPKAQSQKARSLAAGDPVLLPATDFTGYSAGADPAPWPESGIRFDGPDAVLYQNGREIARTPPSDLPADVPQPSEAQHRLSALFPDYTFSFSPPLVVAEAEVLIGSAELRSDLARWELDLGDLYPPSLYGAFDGDIRLVLADGSAHPATYREWRRNVANLDAFAPHLRRVVQVRLPDALGAHREDTVLLLEIGNLVCEAIRAYVGSGGRTTSVRAPEPLSNTFVGGAAPAEANAPLLAGRKAGDVYSPAPVGSLLPG